MDKAQASDFDESVPADQDQDVLNFDVHGNTLFVNVELIWEHHTEFRDACQKLLECSDDHLVIDMTQVDFVFSAYMGTIGMVLREASRTGKRLLIRISPALRWLFEMVRIDRFTQIEVAS